MAFALEVLHAVDAAVNGRIFTVGLAQRLKFISTEKISHEQETVMVVLRNLHRGEGVSVFYYFRHVLIIIGWNTWQELI